MLFKQSKGKRIYEEKKGEFLGNLVDCGIEELGK
jgi:hypothetical protein